MKGFKIKVFDRYIKIFIHPDVFVRDQALDVISLQDLAKSVSNKTDASEIVIYRVVRQQKNAYGIVIITDNHPSVIHLDNLTSSNTSLDAIDALPTVEITSKYPINLNYWLRRLPDDYRKVLSAPVVKSSIVDVSSEELEINKMVLTSYHDLVEKYKTIHILVRKKYEENALWQWLNVMAALPRSTAHLTTEHQRRIIKYQIEERESYADDEVHAQVLVEALIKNACLNENELRQILQYEDEIHKHLDNVNHLQAADALMHPETGIITILQSNYEELLKKFKANTAALQEHKKALITFIYQVAKAYLMTLTAPYSEVHVYIFNFLFQPYVQLVKTNNDYQLSDLDQAYCKLKSKSLSDITKDVKNMFADPASGLNGISAITASAISYLVSSFSKSSVGSRRAIHEEILKILEEHALLNPSILFSFNIKQKSFAWSDSVLALESDIDKLNRSDAYEKQKQEIIKLTNEIDGKFVLIGKIQQKIAFAYQRMSARELETHANAIQESANDCYLFIDRQKRFAKELLSSLDGKDKQNIDLSILTLALPPEENIKQFKVVLDKGLAELRACTESSIDKSEQLLSVIAFNVVRTNKQLGELISIKRKLTKLNAQLETISVDKRKAEIKIKYEQASEDEKLIKHQMLRINHFLRSLSHLLDENDQPFYDRFNQIRERLNKLHSVGDKIDYQSQYQEIQANYDRVHRATSLTSIKHGYAEIIKTVDKFTHDIKPLQQIVNDLVNLNHDVKQLKRESQRGFISRHLSKLTCGVSVAACIGIAAGVGFVLGGPIGAAIGVAVGAVVGLGVGFLTAYAIKKCCMPQLGEEISLIGDDSDDSESEPITGLDSAAIHAKLKESERGMPAAPAIRQDEVTSVPAKRDSRYDVTKALATLHALDDTPQSVNALRK